MLLHPSTRGGQPAKGARGAVVTTVFRGGAVFSGGPTQAWGSALAITGAEIVAVGGEAEVAPFLGQADEVVELQGRLVVPGFVDAHVHPVTGGLERIRCDLTAGSTLADYASTIARYAS